MSRAVLIGLGGIGSHLAEPLARTLVFAEYPRAPDRLLLIDGDRYEEKNILRQRVLRHGNKAEETAEILSGLFPKLSVEAKPRYVDVENMYLFVREDDVVFLAVDNHATRKIVAEHVATLQNILLISGGNEEYDGNTQVHLREGGRDRTPPLTWQHPEIQSPADKHPGERACGELIAEGSAPQLLAVNFMIAALMLSAFTLWLQEKPLSYGGCYLNLLSGNVRPESLKYWNARETA